MNVMATELDLRQWVFASLIFFLPRYNLFVINLRISSNHFVPCFQGVAVAGCYQNYFQK